MKTLKRYTKIHKDKVGKVLKKEPFSFICWVLIAWVIIIAIMFSFDAIFKIIPEFTKFKMKYWVSSLFLTNDIESEKSIFFVLEAVRKNEYLNDDNKEFIEKYLIPEIKENSQFIDLEKVAKRLETLDVEYNKKYEINLKNKEILLNNPKEASLGVAGMYNSIFNKINLYEQIEFENVDDTYVERNYDFVTSDKTVYFHELNHVLAEGNLVSSMSFLNIAKQDILSELINELFAREYYDEERFYGYEEQMMYIYALAEILSENTLREYKFNNNEAIIIAGLLEIDNNLEKAFELINTVEVINENPTDENYKKLHDAYEYFYEKKTGKKIIENGDILAYFYGSKILNDEEKIKFEEIAKIDKLVSEVRIIPKGYVSNDYRSINLNTIVEYVRNGKLQTSKIDL